MKTAGKVLRTDPVNRVAQDLAYKKGYDPDPLGNGLGIYGAKFSGGSVNTSGSADDILQRIYQRDWSNYVTNYQPMLFEAANTIGDNGIVDAAKVQANRMGLRDVTAARRMATRSGESLTPLQAKVATNDALRDSSLAKTAVVNQARLDQRDYDRSMASQMINLSRSGSRTAQESLGAIAGNEASRKSAYDSAKTATQNQNVGMAASAAMLAMMMMS